MSAKLSGFREKHPILYCFVPVVLFMIISYAGTPLWLQIYNWGLLPKDRQIIEYTMLFFDELVSALLMILLLHLTGRLHLLKGRGVKFSTKLSVSAVKLIYSIVYTMAIVGQMIDMQAELQSTGMIIRFLASFCMVGIMEELMCRAIIGETMLEHFGLDSKGVLKASILSGLLFGLLHLMNISGTSTVSSVVIQAVSNIASGILFAAIYFRTGSVWTVAILHVINNISAAVTNGFFVNGAAVYDGATATDLVATATNTTTMSGAIYGLQMGAVLVPTLLQLVLAFFLLRKKKNAEVQKIWGDLVVTKTPDAE